MPSPVDQDDPYLPWTVAFKVFAPGPKEALNAARLEPGATYINAGYYIVAGHDEAARTSADRGGDTLAAGKLPPVPAEPFVEFVEDNNGEPVWINPRHVASVTAGTAVGTTRLEIVGSGTRAVVKGTARRRRQVGAPRPGGRGMSGKNEFVDFMAVARGKPGGDPDFAEALAAVAYTMEGCLAWFRSHLTGIGAADVVAMAKMVEARRLERR